MRHLNDNRAYPPQRRNFSEDWGLDGIPFFDMPSSRGAVYPPPCPFWALQVLPQWHQRCRWGCGPVGSLAELSPGEVGLFVLLSNSVHRVAEAAWCQLDQFERSRLFCVPRLANKVAMFGQFVHTPCFFLECEGPWSRLFLWQHLATLKGQKCEIDSCKWSDLQKSFARGAATDCRPFIDSPDKMAYVCHSLTWHVANMGLVYPHPSPFWWLQVLWLWHQCRWGRRPAGSLAPVSPGEVGLSFLLSNSVQCVAASSQWRMARAAWCRRHPRGGVAPHPWRPRLEAASGAVGGCGGCGVARGDGRFAVHNLWVFAFIWA